MSNQTTNRWTLLLDLFQSYGVLVGSVLVGLALYFLKPDWISSLEPWGETGAFHFGDEYKYSLGTK